MKDTTSTIEYLGNLRTLSIHTNSGEEITTDAPVDNNGKGAYFSPTDLVATGLGCCMLTLMGIASEKHEFNFRSAKVKIRKHMKSDPRRIGKIEVEMNIPGEYTEKQKEILRVAAITCPVAKSLHPEIEQVVTFQFG
ncbi:MAG: OsmC family peroxiredoxin [Bacteroidetes bacterium]|nr:OsmC family peroxiredoxin [Bacteroidota bacterium]